MSLFSQSNLVKYVLMIGLVLTASLFSNKFKAFLGSGHDEENELIRKYLLNDSPMYGIDKPKLWIHTKYAYNARVWQSFGSRSSHDLNQPYIHLCVKTIIHQCGGDFHICLVDDESFHQLLPDWKTKLQEVPEPQRDYHRQLALMMLLYTYGGFLVPNTFVCVKNLQTLYEEYKDRPFVVEMANPFVSRAKKMFVPNPHMIGAPKRHPVIQTFCNHLKTLCNHPFQTGGDFAGVVSEWCSSQPDMVKVDGIYVGARTNQGKVVVLEDLMQQKDLDIFPELLYGVVVPAEAILSRPKYQWFAALTADDILHVDCVVSRLLLQGIVSFDEPDVDTTVTTTVISI